MKGAVAQTLAANAREAARDVTVTRWVAMIATQRVIVTSWAESRALSVRVWVMAVP